MPEKHALFLGCLIPMMFPQIELSARKALAELEVECEEIEGFTCCPEPWNFKGTDLQGWLKVASANLKKADDKDMTITTLCNGCSATLKEARKIEGGDRMPLHAVELLYRDLGIEKIKATVKKPLEGIRVAVHYGCHLLRPSKVFKTDNPFTPLFLDELVEALGAVSVDYQDKMQCCGRASSADEIKTGLAKRKIENVEEADADCIVVTCPACFEQFDLGQLLINRKFSENHGIPVFHYFQLLAVAQGFKPEDLGFGRHRMDVEKVFA